MSPAETPPLPQAESQPTEGADRPVRTAADGRFKLAFIGSHGVGKTTLCYGVAARLKARDVSVEVVHEVARRCPLPINEETGIASESWILHTQVAEEVLAAARYPVVLCDRSILDNYVYLLLADGPQPALDALMEPWMATYDLLVHVPILSSPSPDGLRSVDPSYQRAVDQRLARELETRRLPVLYLGREPTAEPGPDPQGADRDRWVETVFEAIWDRVRPAQLDLLG